MIRIGTFRFGVLLVLLATLVLQAGLTAAAPAQSGQTTSGVWTTVGNIIDGREQHTATLLADGRVLVVGGGGPLTASAERYDSATGRWLRTGSLNVARLGHTATLFNDGRVLVAGGYGAVCASAELFDPARGSWSSTGNMIDARAHHTATRLNNGLVLVAGGAGSSTEYNNAIDRAELFNPATGVWVATASMASTRLIHTATLLADGQVLVSAGRCCRTDGALVRSTELFGLPPDLLQGTVIDASRGAPVAGI